MPIADAARKIPGVDAITTALKGTDALTAQEVKRYERDHKSRAGVIETAEKRVERN